MSSESAHYRSYSLNKEQIPPVIVEKLDDIERINLKEKIKKKLKQQGAVIVSHYYTDSDLQLLADETGGCVSDSLDMARFDGDEVMKRLSHPHVDHVGQPVGPGLGIVAPPVVAPLPLGGLLEQILRLLDLVDDLPRGQASLEGQTRGRAEPAGHGASDL